MNVILESRGAHLIRYLRFYYDLEFAVKWDS